MKTYTCKLKHKSNRVHLNYISRKLECGRHHCCALVTTIVNINDGRIKGYSNPRGFEEDESSKGSLSALYWEAETPRKEDTGVTINWGHNDISNS